MDTHNLANEIAAYRCMMNGLSKGKSLTHPDVIRLRRGLDNLIHKYYYELHNQGHALFSSRILQGCTRVYED